MKFYPADDTSSKVRFLSNWWSFLDRYVFSFRHLDVQSHTALLQLLFFSSDFPERTEILVEGAEESAVRRETKQNISLAETDKVASERA